MTYQLAPPAINNTDFYIYIESCVSSQVYDDSTTLLYEDYLQINNRSFEENILVPYAKCNLNNFEQPDERNLQKNLTFNNISSSSGQKKLYAQCVDKYSLMVQSLQPGSACENDWQCISNNCENSHCIGFKEEQLCQRDRQCNIGLYCDMSLTKKCSKCAGKIIDPGNGGELILDKTIMTCIKMYSIDIGGFAEDKELCKTGIVVNYRCRNITEIRFQGKVLKEPFQCNPSLQQICEYYGPTLADPIFLEKLIEYPCKCVMDGNSQNGVCQYPLLHQKLAEVQKTLLNNYLQNCHTYNRNQTQLWLQCYVEPKPTVQNQAIVNELKFRSLFKIQNYQLQ
eukprot:403375478